jgi:ribosomal protein S18 acetylase RimI-like enzyme
MKLREHAGAREFLAAAAPVLEADEARHNLGYGICSTLIESPGTYPRFHLWTVEADEGVAGAAMMTPPHNLWLARPADSAVLELLARELAARGIGLPGVTAAQPEVDAFAAEWQRLKGVGRRLLHAQGIYAVSDVRMPTNVPGALRNATADDRRLLIDWWRAFIAEALHEGGPETDAEEAIDRRLVAGVGGLGIWDDGTAVSFAGYGGETPNGVRIGPVYTPPEHRRRGYGSALTAALSRRLLGEGRRYCFLYTDLANPTANRIYRAIGYELVCESAMYEFA